MNALESYRLNHGLSRAALAKKIGRRRDFVWRHCRAQRIPGDAALFYSKALGIPLEDLRPDIQPQAKTATPPPEAA